jgi:hypothetical protein
MSRIRSGASIQGGGVLDAPREPQAFPLQRLDLDQLKQGLGRVDKVRQHPAQIGRGLATIKAYAGLLGFDVTDGSRAKERIRLGAGHLGPKIFVGHVAHGIEQRPLKRFGRVRAVEFAKPFVRPQPDERLRAEGLRQGPIERQPYPALMIGQTRQGHRTGVHVASRPNHFDQGLLILQNAHRGLPNFFRRIGQSQIP